MADALCRTSCPCCGTAANPEPICVTPPQPVFQGLVAATDDTRADASAPQEWLGCSSCGSAFLRKLQPLELVYGGFTAGSFGGVWDAHHALLAEFVLTHGGGGSVLEAGGGVGALAAAYRACGGTADWTILEPNPSPLLAGCTGSVEVQRGFFHPGTPLGGAQTLVFSHCLEHFYDLRAAVADLGARLPQGGTLFVSWPQTEDWLRRGVPGAINWEHTFHVPLAALVELHAEHGLALVARTDFRDHSHFLAFTAAPRRAPKWPSYAASEVRELTRSYWRSFSECAARVTLRLARAPAPHYLMPASLSSQVLLAHGLSSPHLAGLLDNNPAKRSRRLYGTPFFSALPKEAIPNGIATVVVIGSTFTAEIAASLRVMNPDVVVIDAASDEGTAGS
jgi:hypothetical protein